MGTTTNSVDRQNQTHAATHNICGLCVPRRRCPVVPLRLRLKQETKQQDVFCVLTAGACAPLRMSQWSQPSRHPSSLWRGGNEQSANTIKESAKIDTDVYEYTCTYLYILKYSSLWRGERKGIISWKTKKRQPIHKTYILKSTHTHICIHMHVDLDVMNIYTLKFTLRPSRHPSSLWRGEK